MGLHTGMLRVTTPGNGEVVDLTDGVRGVLRGGSVRNGVVTVFVTGSTAAITTIEFEPGAVHDLAALLERLIPAGRDYEHNRRNADDNAHAHLRAALIGASETVPIIEGHLALGTWQQIVLIDFDTRPRERTITVQAVV